MTFTIIPLSPTVYSRQSVVSGLDGRLKWFFQAVVEIVIEVFMYADFHLE